MLRKKKSQARSVYFDELFTGKAIETGMILSITDMKNTFKCFFHRPIFTKIKEFATSVLCKLVVHFGYRGHNCTGVDMIS